MASPSPDTSPTANFSYRSMLIGTPQWQALDRLADFDLSKNGILALLKLGAAEAGKIFDVINSEGRSGVEKLLGSLRSVPEEEMEGWIDAVANERKAKGRALSINPLRSPIDNGLNATTATSLATHHLRPPLPSRASLRQSSSVGSRSVSSRASSSTNITHPSAQHRVSKRELGPKQPRRQFYCPICGKNIRNAFDKHFKAHFKDLLDAEVGEHDAIGCGYCPAHDLLIDQGKVFRGKTEFLHHIKDAHASTPHILHWDLNASFNHILSAQPVFRRKIVLMAEQRTRQSGPPGNDTFLALSWVPSPLTRRLLRDLQAVSGRMDIDPASIDDERIDNLMLHVYQAAAQQWRPYSALADVPQHVAPRATPHRAAMQPPLERSSQDAMSFVGMGQHFLDAPTPQYPTGMNSPSILTPSPQAPQPPHHFQRGVLQQGGMDVENQNVEQHHTGGSDRYDQPPTIAFDGHASFDTATLPPSQGSFEEMYRDLGIRETDLYDP